MKKSSFYVCALVCLCACFPLKCGGAGLLFRLFGAEAKICVTVVDDDGRPVEGALVLVTYRQYNWARVNNVEKLTDVNGYAELVGRCDELDADVVIKKEGYYTTRESRAFVQIGSAIKVEDGKWQPYGAHRTYVLKKIRKPVPMVVFSDVFMYYVPEQPGKELGYDLEYGDFVKPYGDGEVADFFVKFDWNEDNLRMVKTMTMTLPNALDGAYICPLHESSLLTSPYRADVGGKYLKEFAFSKTRSKDPKEGFWRVVAEEKLSSEQGMILRTRTKVDANGTLVSAHYSKIYGNFGVDGQSSQKMGIVGGVTTYFNPVVNDTNLECDGQRHPELRKGKRRNTAYGPSGAL